ncbi:Cna B-type domain-containing protein, partial [Bacillus thuringiensis]
CFVQFQKVRCARLPGTNQVTCVRIYRETLSRFVHRFNGNATNRPEIIKVDLLQSGKVIDTKEVSAAGEWKYAFTDLAAYDAEGNAYKYEVKEQPVDGYKSEVNGYDITNTKVAQTIVEGTKTWKDGNATNRPEIIKVDLLQSGKVIDTKK